MSVESHVFAHTEGENARLRYFKDVQVAWERAKVLSGEGYDSWWFHWIGLPFMHPPRIHMRRSALPDDSTDRVFPSRPSSIPVLPVSSKVSVSCGLFSVPSASTEEIFASVDDHLEIPTTVQSEGEESQAPH